jgi:uncharacterized protein YndB with AHSA1/START domain
MARLVLAAGLSLVHYLPFGTTVVGQHGQYADNAKRRHVMIKGEGNLMINRPIEAVWKFLTDLENYPMWHKGMVEARKTSEGPMDMGTTIEVTAEIPGRHTMKLVITDFEPNRKIAWRVDARPVTGAAGYVARCTFEPVQGGTRVFKFIEGDFAGFFRLLEPILSRPLKRIEIETELSNAKRLLEAKV